MLYSSHLGQHNSTKFAQIYMNDKTYEIKKH